MLKYKYIFLLTFVMAVSYSVAQDVYFTRSGHIYFISHTDIIDIDANNHQAAGFLDVTTGKVQCAVLIKSFEFTLATAKEHFNESYMDSDKFPKAEFKGEIVNINSINLAEQGSYLATVKGKLTIKGQTKDLETQVEMIVKESEILASCSFDVTISDFNIKVPALVENRVAKVVQVSLGFKYQPYKK